VIRLVADENFNSDIIGGLIRRKHEGISACLPAYERH
jgi:hypothetical protein